MFEDNLRSLVTQSLQIKNYKVLTIIIIDHL